MDKSLIPNRDTAFYFFVSIIFIVITIHAFDLFLFYDKQKKLDYKHYVRLGRRKKIKLFRLLRPCGF